MQKGTSFCKLPLSDIIFPKCVGKITGQRDRPGTDRDSCPEMSGFFVPRDLSTETVPQIFVPVFPEKLITISKKSKNFK